jgi:hypothetical protein
MDPILSIVVRIDNVHGGRGVAATRYAHADAMAPARVIKVDDPFGYTLMTEQSRPKVLVQ